MNNYHPKSRSKIVQLKGSEPVFNGQDRQAWIHWQKSKKLKEEEGKFKMNAVCVLCHLGNECANY